MSERDDRVSGQERTWVRVARDVRGIVSGVGQARFKSSGFAEGVLFS
jgi:hypothetical protein